MNHRRVDFKQIADAALANAETIVYRWCPDGKRAGNEWIARNPRRSDNKLGSFKINLQTGAWADFADGARGGDLISLAAYLFGTSQKEAAVNTAKMLGLTHE
jgi:hypothetical protein